MNMNHRPLKQRKRTRKVKSKARQRATNSLRALRSKRQRRKLFRQLIEEHKVAGMETAQPHGHASGQEASQAKHSAAASASTKAKGSKSKAGGKA